MSRTFAETGRPSLIKTETDWALLNVLKTTSLRKGKRTYKGVISEGMARGVVMTLDRDSPLPAGVIVRVEGLVRGDGEALLAHALNSVELLIF